MALGADEEIRAGRVTDKDGRSLTFARPSATWAHAKIDRATLGDGVAVVAKFKSGAATDLSGGLSLAQNGGVSFAGNGGSPAFETAAGEALVLNLSGAIQVSGHVGYEVI